MPIYEKKDGEDTVRQESPTKKVLLYCSFPCALCVVMFVVLLVASAEMMGKMNRIENALRTTQNGFDTYVAANSTFSQEVTDRLNALDYERLNEAIKKLEN